jgi:myo-inositol-1(or 4)-monophosphatase
MTDGVGVAEPTSAELLDIAVTVARQAGEFLLAGRAVDLVIETKSSPTDVVTQMDTAAERLIATAIAAARPADTLLGEEGSVAVSSSSAASVVANSDAGGHAVRWIVDPIDGTVNYLYGLPQWAVSIAAERDGVVVAGAVFDPSKNEMFTAERGGGAYLNGRPIRVSACAELALALIGTGFGYDAGRRARQAEVVRSLLPVVRDIRRLGAASLDLCALACGRLDGYFERGLNLWDYAAAGLIAAEAGARVEGLAGTSPSTAFVVAAPRTLFAALHDLLASLGADQV